MSIIVERFKNIKSNIEKSEYKNFAQIVAVSKTFDLDHIKPLIDFGHVHFVRIKFKKQSLKWSSIKKINNKLKLHMVGKLQSNKAKKAIELFDFIHSLDSQKLADVPLRIKTN